MKLEIGMLTPDMIVEAINNQPNRHLKEFLDKLEETMHPAGGTVTYRLNPGEININTLVTNTKMK